MRGGSPNELQRKYYETSTIAGTAERRRLLEAGSREDVAPLGALPERAAVGNRARMVQDGQRHRPVDRLRARRGAVPRLPVGRGRSCSASATSAGSSASRWRSGTRRTRSSRSACSGSPKPKATTARTSRRYYFYLDNLPTHAYMKGLYKYPYEYPYADLKDRSRAVSTPRIRARQHGQARGQCVLRRLRRVRQSRSRGHPHPDHRGSTGEARRRRLHVLPTLWLRNTWSWSWGRGRRRRRSAWPVHSGPAILRPTSASCRPRYGSSRTRSPAPTTS